MENLMKSNGKKINLILVLFTAFAFAFSSCSKEEIAQASKVSFQATDAPIDNAEVSGVFLTVSEIYVDGNKVDGFSKTTLEVSALTNGKTEVLKEAELDASSFSQVTLVLDYEQDAQGNVPGCYVKKVDNTKDKIVSSSNEIQLQKQVELAANATTDVVLDFDLRKLINEESGDYELVTKAEMESSVRAVVKSNTGTIKGKINSMNSASGKVVAYVYKKGTYDQNTEVSGQGQSNVQFAGAVNSATIDSNGDFMVSFLEEGEYEIHAFEYEDTNNDGKIELVSKVTLSSTTDISLTGLDVNANSTTDLNIDITGVINL